jgi:hypothetical protein
MVSHVSFHYNLILDESCTTQAFLLLRTARLQGAQKNNPILSSSESSFTFLTLKGETDLWHRQACVRVFPLNFEPSGRFS